MRAKQQSVGRNWRACPGDHPGAITATYNRTVGSEVPYCAVHAHSLLDSREAQEDARLAKLPRGFVYLRDIAPEIQQDIRKIDRVSARHLVPADLSCLECVQ
jgi:hypothetical protein